MRVAVRNVINLPNHSALVERFSNLLINIPDVLALPFTLFVIATIINIQDKWKSELPRQCIVLFTIGRRQVNNPGTVFQSHIIGVPNFMGLRTAIFKQRLIAFTDQFLAFKFANNFIGKGLVFGIG